MNISMPCWWLYTWEWSCWTLNVCVCVFSCNSVSHSYTRSSQRFTRPPAVWVASSCSIASPRLGVACFVVSNGAVLMAAKWYLIVVFLFLMFTLCFFILYEMPVQVLCLFFLIGFCVLICRSFYTFWIHVFCWIYYWKHLLVCELSFLSLNGAFGWKES